MARLFTVAQIAELALQRIGAFSVNDPQADAAEMERAIQWLEIAVSEFSGTEYSAVLEHETLIAALDPPASSYVLADLYGADWPDEDMAFAIRVQIRDTTAGTNDQEVQLINRQQYLDIENKSQTGLAQQAWIDRAGQPTIHLDRTPGATATYSLLLSFQTYNRDMMAGSSEGQGNIAHGFKAEWQKWLILACACEIGDGPVRKLPVQELRELRAQRKESYDKLMAAAARFTVSLDNQRTRAWGM